jgi:diguanylate cyclase (GGDEF)-like protein
MSRTDALTGIYNRAYFNERMEQEWRRAMRLGHPIGLLILDVDFFKAVNDTHGHPGGDACLVAVAQLLQKHLHRAADACFRYGGEEFVILLPSTGLDGTTHLARQVLASLRQMQIEFQGKTFSITASVGAAATEPKYSHAGPDGLVGVADAALYAAKRQGRDQVVSATTQVTNTTVG